MTNIKKMLAEGNEADAETALENLLFLGPQNTEALKLKSLLLRQKGDFDGEYRMWQKIIEVDREDTDAISYFRSRFTEEQERFYFIEDIPDQGKRFILYPRGLVNSSFNALLGCSFFLLVPYLLKILASPALFLPLLASAFVLMVVLPWASIIKAMLSAPKFILLSAQGLKLGRGFRVYSFAWSEFQGIYMARGGETEKNEVNLNLVLMALDPEKKCIIIDFNQETSSLRAKNYFLKEFKFHCGKIDTCLLQELSLKSRKTIRI